jgi:hypothetical protein
MRRKTIFSLFIFTLIIQNIAAQERVITGKVLDYKGRPVAGVNIIVKDYTSLSTISGADGMFKIPIYNFTKVLQFSFPGMQSKEVSISGKKDLMVVMDYLPGHNPYPWNIVFYSQVYEANIYNKSKNNDSSWVCSGAPGLSLSLEIEYFISQKFGISTGIGINTYSAKAWLNNFNNYGINNVKKVDKDNETYFLYNNAYSVEENSVVKSISLPLKIKYRFKPGKKWDYFIDAGIKLMYITEAHIKARGKTEWQGYYPSYHVVLYDVPEYGFTKYEINSENKIPDYSKLMLSITGNIGISISIGINSNLDLGFFYEHGISDLNYTQPAYEADFINTTGITSKTFLTGKGAIIGFRYNF